MHFSNDKQSNPGENIPRLVENISKLVERLPKRMPSVETTLITTPITTTTPVENNRQKQGICTGICALLKKARSNTKKKAEITLRSDQDVSYRTNERSSTYFQLLKLRKNLHQMTDSFTRLQKFESELAMQIQSRLHDLNAILELQEKTQIRSTEYPLGLYEINKEIMKLKYQIPSPPIQSWTSSSVLLHTSSGSIVRRALLEKLPNLYQSKSFYQSSFFKEISDIFEGLDDKRKFYLSCFAVLPEHAVVKRTLLTYWWLGEGFLPESDSTTLEEIVDVILRELHEMGLIEPAVRKRKLEVRSYKMDPLVRSAVIILCQDARLFDVDSNGNVVENRAPANRAFLVKDEEKSSDDKILHSRQGEQQSQNLDQEKLDTLFNINEVSLDLKLEQLANKKDVNVVQWLSKMKRIKVLHLGRWQISAKYHVELDRAEFLEELKSMEQLRFLSLRGISRINALPSSIGMLSNLIILDLKECPNLEKLPEEIASLKSLVYMDISNCYFLDRMPGGISELSKLQVLKGFLMAGSSNMNVLRKLKNLRKLAVIATSDDFPTKKDLQYLQELGFLRKLKIAWEARLSKEAEQLEPEPEVYKISGKLEPMKLEKLDLQFLHDSTPTWLTPELFPFLEKLYIKGGELATLGKDKLVKWNKVQTLRLKYLSEMKTNWRVLRESFPELVYLEKFKCPGITLCPCDENGVWIKNIKRSCM